MLDYFTNIFNYLWLGSLIGIIFVIKDKKKLQKNVKNIGLVLLVLLHAISINYVNLDAKKIESFINDPEIESVLENDSNIDEPNNINKRLINLDNIPQYTDQPYVVINDNKPYFTEDQLVEASYEKYSELDSLGRCGVAIANIDKQLMPTESRKSIGSVKPSGWHTVKYNNVDGKYLYNRAHLIGYQLTGENANKNNLITGTRYFNVEGMLPFENMVADYIKETNNHVLYRVTPIFEGNNLVASGVLMEAQSIEDAGKGIMFNVYCYNVQPGITINYQTGESNLTK